jgi:hypothetical protein
MFNITASVKENDQALQAMQAAMKELENIQVLVGIPEDESARQEGKITNAALMYIHSNGSPKQGIPARPVIEPALELNKERIGTVIGAAMKAAMAGDTSTMRQQLERAGLAGQNAAKDWFTNPSNNFAPLSEERRKQKEKKGSDIERPLIDTGDLQNSITYVVREK